MTTAVPPKVPCSDLELGLAAVKHAYYTAGCAATSLFELADFRQSGAVTESQPGAQRRVLEFLAQSSLGSKRPKHPQARRNRY